MARAAYRDMSRLTGILKAQRASDLRLKVPYTAETPHLSVVIRYAAQNQ